MSPRKRHKGAPEEETVELPLKDEAADAECFFKLRECLGEYRSEVDRLQACNGALLRENDCLRHLCASVGGIWDVLGNELDRVLECPAPVESADPSAAADEFLERLSRTRLPFTVSFVGDKASSDPADIAFESTRIATPEAGGPAPGKSESDGAGDTDRSQSFVAAHVEAFNGKKDALLSRVKRLAAASAPPSDDGKDGAAPAPEGPQDLEKQLASERSKCRVLELAIVRLGDSVSEYREHARDDRARCGSHEVEISRLTKLNASMRHSLDAARAEVSRLDEALAKASAEAEDSSAESTGSPYEHHTPAKSISTDELTVDMIVGTALYSSLYEKCKSLDDEIWRLERDNASLRKHSEELALEHDRKLLEVVQKLDSTHEALVARVEEYDRLVESLKDELSRQREKQEHLGSTTAELRCERDSLRCELQEKDRTLQERLSQMAQVISAFTPSDPDAAGPNSPASHDHMQALSLELEEISMAYEEKLRHTDILLQQLTEAQGFRERCLTAEAGMRELQDKLTRTVALCDRTVRDAYQHKEDLSQRLETYRASWIESQRRCQVFEQKRDLAASALCESQAQLRRCQVDQIELKARLLQLQGTPPASVGLSFSAEFSGERGDEFGSVVRENTVLRRRMTCTVCSEHFRDRCLTKCGHVFCEPCITRNLKSRNRKCPVCKLVAARRAGSGGSTAEAAGPTGGHAGGSSSLVHLGGEGLADLLDLLELVLELLLGGGLVGLEPLDGLVNGGEGSADLAGLELRLDGVLVKGVPHAVAVVLKLVLGLHARAPVLVLLLELLGLSNHALNVGSAETALVVGDGDVLRFAGGLVHGSDVEDTVGVDVEGDLDLGNTPGSRSNASEVELSEQVVVLGHGTLALEDLNEHTLLLVLVGGEDLGLLGGNGGVSLDEHRHDTTGGLETEGQGSDIEQQKLLDLARLVTGKDGGLDGGTVGDGLVRVDRAAGLLAVEEVLDEGLNLGDTGGTADEHDLVDLPLVKTTGLQSLLDGDEGAPELLATHFLETSTADGGVVVDTLVKGVELNGGLSRAGEHTLGAFTVGPETTESTLVAGEVLAVVDPHEVTDTVLDQKVVKVLTSEVGVTGGGLDFENTVLNGKNGDIESTTSQVEDEHVFLVGTLLVKTVGNGSGGRLVDDTHNVETSNGAGVLGGLTLGVVEVGGDGDDGVLDGLAEVELSNLLHLDENHRGDFLRVEGLLLPLEGDLNGGLSADTVDDLERPVLHVILNGRVVKPSSDKPLRVENGVFGVAGFLVLGSVTNETLGVGEGDIRGGRPVTLVVGDDLNIVVLVNTHTRVGGTQIDTDGWSRHFGCYFRPAQ
ncbi:NAD-specific glutamate dehydrogenase [Babesia caballi]|uniref:E3 ubiquitin protein ligase n=1 Tax=Babesia caballi TaxID=5871 RepID=A0AAV4LVF3_BABCB|nr:NAD-specific glutamate dehydrogenase [Babesia caballi]